MRDETELNDYQTVAIWHLIEHPFTALWLDMGLGKTIAALSALAWLRQMGEVRRVLVVAPKKVAMSTWPDEIRAWNHTAGLSWTIIRPTGREPEVEAARGLARAAARRINLPADFVLRIENRAATRAEERVRERLLRTETDIHIATRENMPYLVEKWGRRWPYDLVIYDEASGLRDHNTNRVKSLFKARQRVKRLWQLTGTPAPEGYIDLFPQVYLLDRGERFGKHIGRFRDAYFTHDPHRHKYTLREGMADAIISRIGDLALVMRAEDYLPVNAPVYVERLVDLGPELLETYETLERDMVASTPSGHEIVAEVAGSLHQKLLQFASGAVYDEDGKAHFVHDCKIDALRDIVEESQGAPIIVAYWFQSSLARLRKAFPEGKKADDAGKIVKEWTAGTLPMMFIHPASDGAGLNLQYGGHILVFFDVPYSGEKHDQTVARIARQGQTRVPMVFYLCARGTVDQGIVPVLRAKGDAQDYLFQRLKRLRHETVVEEHGL